MSVRAYIKENKGSLIRTIVIAFLVSQLPYLKLYYTILTDDGHGIYTAPEDIEPAPVLAEPWPPIAAPEGPLPRLSVADLKTYFFPPEPSLDHYGRRIQRFEDAEIAVDLGGSYGDILGAIWTAVPNLPRVVQPTRAENGAYDPWPDMIAYVGWKKKKAEYRLYRYGPYREENDMLAQGCLAAVSLSVMGPAKISLLPPHDKPLLSEAQGLAKDFAIDWVGIATRHYAGEATVDHCLFKALLVALGLHPTDDFFFREGPVTPAEQAKALAALALLYHPAVRPGMTEAEFTQTLLGQGLIDP